jgi:hypothetical protein
LPLADHIAFARNGTSVMTTNYMIAQFARMVGFNITGLILCLALILVAPPRAAAGAGTVESGANAPVITIQVQSADGKPLPRAIVVCIGHSTIATLKGTDIEGGSQRFQTDGEGWVSLPRRGQRRGQS